MNKPSFIHRLMQRLNQQLSQQFNPSKVPCYHCDEQAVESGIVLVDFNGEQKSVCCHGCATILLMVQANGLTQQYLSDKSALTEV